MSEGKPLSALQLVATPKTVLGLGCEYLDAFLGGGIGLGITEISGESATGKTNILLQLLLQVQLPQGLGGLDGLAFYLSTEDLSMGRLKQLQTAYHQKHKWTQAFEFLDNVYVHQVSTLDDQFDVLLNRLPVLLESQNIRLVVIDSIAALYRTEFGIGEYGARSKELFEVAQHLKAISAKYSVPIVVANQVTDLFEEKVPIPHFKMWSARSSGRNVIPSLGLSWASCTNTRILLTRENHRVSTDQFALNQTVTKRHMHVIFSPNLPRGNCEFEIDNLGVHGLPPLPAPS